MSLPDPHPVIAALDAELSQRNLSSGDVVRLVVYFGVPPQAGWRRLHRSPADLSEYIDVKDGDIVHHAEVPEASLGPGALADAYYVWIPKDAMVTSASVRPASTQARYLQGDITAANLGEALRRLANSAKAPHVERWGETGDPC